MSHTQTPWEFDGSGFRKEGETWYLLHAYLLRDAYGHGAKLSITAQDAEFIVRACNAHDGLLDAIYRALPFVEEAETDPHYKTGAAKQVVNIIRSAIGKAEGKK